MKVVNLPNRPERVPDKTRIIDFADSNTNVRVSLKLAEADNDKIVIDAQAFEIDGEGRFLNGPDGRPSRTSGSKHVVLATSLGDTHTLKPGWVRVVGDYNQDTFESTAPRAAGQPSNDYPPDFDTNPTGQYYDIDTGVGYRWDEGELVKIARGKAHEMGRIVRNSNSIAGIDF